MSEPVLAEIDPTYINAIAHQSSRNVPLQIICDSLCLSPDQVANIKTTQAYREAVSLITSNRLAASMKSDDQWDEVEKSSLAALIHDVQTNPQSMTSMELLNIAKNANAAKRRHVEDKSATNGSINITSNVVNLSIPTIVLDQLRNLNKSTTHIKSDEAIAIEYGIDLNDSSKNATAFTLQSVSDALGVKIDRAAIKDEKPSDEYMQHFESSLDTALDAQYTEVG